MIETATAADAPPPDSSLPTPSNRYPCRFTNYAPGEYLWRPWDEEDYPAAEFPWGPGFVDYGTWSRDYGVVRALGEYAVIGCNDDYASDEPMLFIHRKDGEIGVIKLRELRYVAQALERQRTDQRTLGPMLLDGVCCHSVVPVPPDNITDDERWRVLRAFGDIMEGCDGKDGPVFDRKEMGDENGQDDELTAFLRRRPRTIDQYEQKEMEEAERAGEEAER